jgi:hypothetical protein
MRLGPLCLVVGAVVVVVAVPGGAAAARTPLTVSPAPGTPDASPKTGISVLGVPAGAGAGSLQPVGTSARRTDFETRINVPSSAPAFAVRAPDGRGHVLATSPVATA